MDLNILIIGLCICLLTASIFLYFKNAKDDVNTVLLKTLCSFCFLATAILLTSSKSSATFYNGYAISCLIIGLISCAVSNVLYELKAIYPFHEKKYYLSGNIASIITNVINIVAIILIASNSLDIFSSKYLLPILIVLVVAILLAVCLYFILTKKFKIDFRIYKLQTFINILILFITAIFALYIAFESAIFSIFALAIAFVLKVISNILHIVINFGEIKDNKVSISYNILNILSIVATILFIYLI